MGTRLKFREWRLAMDVSRQHGARGVARVAWPRRCEASRRSQWRRCSTLALLAALLINSPTVRSYAQEASQRDGWSAGFIKGMTWGWVGRRGEYAAPAAAQSMRKLKDTNAEWVC